MLEYLGKPIGSSCIGDAECMSGACRKVGGSGSSICVGRCKSQSDCDLLPGSMTCQPERGGDTAGLCVPPSANHCASCHSLPHIREVMTVHRNNYKGPFLHCIKCRCSALFTLFLLVTVLVLSSSSNVYATETAANYNLSGTNKSTGY